MKNIITISLFALFLISISHAQEQLSRKQQADLQFNRFEYFNAAGLYLPLAEKKKPDVKVVEKLAACYRMMNDYGQAEKWYSVAIADPKAEALSHYYYAQALQTNQKFDAAKTQYQIYGSKTGKTEQMSFRINSCDSAAFWMKNPVNISIKNMQELNSSAADWGMNDYGRDGFVFTSERSLQKNPKIKDIYKWTGNPWLKLYLANAKGQLKEELTVATDLSLPSKTEYHVGPMVLNAAGDTAYVTIATREQRTALPVEKVVTERLYTRRLELISAVKKDGKWGDLKAFPYNNVKEYSLGNAAISKDGRILYFTSDRPGGQGKTDIWYSEKQADGSWGNPLNCGPEINTPEEENFPTIVTDGSLYYSSKGKIGLGGYDIYLSKGEKSKWGKSLNLKYPLNTTSDDFYLTSDDGRSGYFSSNRPGGLGNDDIYAFNRPDEPVVVAEKPVQPVVPKIPSDRPEKGQLFVIYYDFDRSKIRTDAVPVLDSLSVLMRKYPEIHVALSSHTDSRGNDDYNMILSDKRVKSAIAYLVKKGIASERITGKGYGETRLLNNCNNGVKCTEAKHQLNRRTEAMIVN
ncbi:OmpA family protein [Pedobacter sp. N36a]|uniref:OmpA family protein n=1 Tax=Pedobacter sp. N36a TaxID=2767996 RepID=UPI001656F5AD|nr:OmpA family protein [Pedobacter sp. N36a]MBC8987828.1 OmpA family protein [Pedobacter sp. N36a]